jgi:hypothetical protein
MYITGVGKRRDSWAGVAIYRAAIKAISYKIQSAGKEADRER